MVRLWKSNTTPSTVVDLEYIVSILFERNFDQYRVGLRDSPHSLAISEVDGAELIEAWERYRS